MTLSQSTRFRGCFKILNDLLGLIGSSLLVSVSVHEMNPVPHCVHPSIHAFVIFHVGGYPLELVSIHGLYMIIK